MAFKLDSNPTQQQKKTVDFDSLLKKEITLFHKSFSNKKKEAFYTELAVLLNAGISLKDTLSLITQEIKNKKDKELFENIIDNIIKGSSFSDTISNYKDFTEYEYYSIKIGEETGTLQKVTKELGLFFKRRNEQKRNIINALTYPVVILTTALLAVLFMLKFVVPMFAGIFKQNNVELPWITKVIMSFSDGFQKYFGVFVLLLIALLLFKKAITKKEWYLKFSSALVLKTPFVGELVRKMYMAQFTQATALLTSAKVPRHYDLVLLDIGLPPSLNGAILSGEDLGIEIKKLMPKCKTIISTSYSDAYRLHGILNSVNPDGLLVKSDVTFKEIVSAINKVLLEPPYYSQTILDLLRKQISTDYALDKIDRQLLYELSIGTKMKELPSILPMSLTTIEKRKYFFKEIFNVQKKSDRDLVLVAKEKGFI